jgi:hypothetical protein
MPNYFTLQQAVEFTHKGTLYKGVVVGLPARGKGRYKVQCERGCFNAPAAMLRPSRIAPTAAAALAQRGSAHLQRRAEHKDARSDSMRSACQRWIRTEGLHAGMPVKNKYAMGHPTVIILDVLHEEGKCIVTNPKRELAGMLTRAGIPSHELGRLARTRGSITVWANRLYPIT